MPQVPPSGAPRCGRLSLLARPPAPTTSRGVCRAVDDHARSRSRFDDHVLHVPHDPGDARLFLHSLPEQALQDLAPAQQQGGRVRHHGPGDRQGALLLRCGQHVGKVAREHRAGGSAPGMGLVELHHAVPIPRLPGHRSRVAVDRDNFVPAASQEQRADGPGYACSRDRDAHVNKVGPFGASGDLRRTTSRVTGGQRGLEHRRSRPRRAGRSQVPGRGPGRRGEGTVRDDRWTGPVPRDHASRGLL